MQQTPTALLWVGLGTLCCGVIVLFWVDKAIIFEKICMTLCVAGLGCMVCGFGAFYKLSMLSIMLFCSIFVIIIGLILVYFPDRNMFSGRRKDEPPA
jgi:hypothetical protein